LATDKIFVRSAFFIIGFFPFGFLLPLISGKFRRFTRVLAATFFLSLTFELDQLIFRLGIFDMDDFLLNTLGGACRYALFPRPHLLAAMKSRRQQHTTIKP